MNEIDVRRNVHTIVNDRNISQLEQRVTLWRKQWADDGVYKAKRLASDTYCKTRREVNIG